VRLYVTEENLLDEMAVRAFLANDYRRVVAAVTLVCADASGSIHRIAAHVQGLDACNGWTFWYYRDKGAKQPIDLLRQRARAELN